MLIVLVALVGLSTFLLAASLIRYFTRTKLSVSERMNQFAQQAAPAKQAVAQAATGGRYWERLLGFVRHMAESIGEVPNAKSLEVLVQRAGLPMQGKEYLILAIGSTLIVFLLTLILLADFLRAAVLGLVWLSGTYAYLPFRISRRMRDFQIQLGDALTMLANALKAGFSFLQALDTVAKEMPQPIAQEFGRTMREIQLGRPTEEALVNLTERVKSDDLDLMITAVLIQRQVGGNLAQILEVIGKTIRERIKMKAEIKTLTAEGRMSGWVIGLAPFALVIFMTLMNPQYMDDMLAEPLGRIAMLLALANQVVGLLIINRIVNVRF